MQPRKGKGIVSAINQGRYFWPQVLHMMAHDLGRGDCHGRVDEDLGRAGESATLDTLAEEKEELLHSLECKGGNDDVAAALERTRHSLIEFLNRWPERLVQSVTVCRFHHDIDCLWRPCGIAQQRVTRFAEVARKQHGRDLRVFVELQKDTGLA